ncbi:MAG: MotA/TolQ/ExbB proton channel family protein [Candidatus Aureabacteria bacterium]|nr:MotA/TolQ/ExbB proton channel family protein [Candidatus Auribacterota bacterium]
MIDIIVKGGPVMIPIIAGSVAGLAIVVERLWFFRQMRLDTYGFVEQVFTYLKEGRADRDLELCKAYGHHPLAAVFRIGISRSGLPLDRLEKILEQAGNNQVQKFERHLGALVSITGIEPLLGFLGTITGLIRAFMSWERAGAEVTVSVLAAGIYEAMITTAAGLIIAIPLSLCYNYFVNRTKRVAADLNNHSIQLIEVIAEIREERP